MTNATQSHYIHGTSADEQRRLGLMNELMNRPSLEQMALEGSERLIDFGSGLGQFSRAMARKLPRGRVIGIERSEEQIRTAEQLALRDGEGGLVEFRQADIYELGLPPAEQGSFDVAHCRFLLEHLPDPLQAARTIVQSVRPGGRIILADDDHEVMRFWPEPPGFVPLWQAYMRTYDRIGNDPYVGRRLVKLVHDAGAVPVRNTWIFFGGCAGQEVFPTLVDNLTGILRGARETIVGMELFEDSDFDDVLASMARWSQRPDAAIWFAMSWAEGRRPE
jgi:SAM-dependent methyltransferase